MMLASNSDSSACTPDSGAVRLPEHAIESMVEALSGEPAQQLLRWGAMKQNYHVESDASEDLSDPERLELRLQEALNVRNVFIKNNSVVSDAFKATTAQRTKAEKPATANDAEMLNLIMNSLATAQLSVQPAAESAEFRNGLCSLHARQAQFAQEISLPALREHPAKKIALTKKGVAFFEFQVKLSMLSLSLLLASDFVAYELFTELVLTLEAMDRKFARHLAKCVRSTELEVIRAAVNACAGNRSGVSIGALLAEDNTDARFSLKHAARVDSRRAASKTNKRSCAVELVEVLRGAMREKKERRTELHTLRKLQRLSQLPSKLERADVPRLATREMLQNKGLTRKRKRTEGNARVHNRERYARKLKKLSSRRRKHEEADERGGYEGEASGITAHVSRSRRINS